MRKFVLLAAAAALASLSACEVNVHQGENEAAEAGSNQVNQAPADPFADREESIRRANDLALTFGNEKARAEERQNAARELENLRYEVDISDRKLRIFRGETLMETHDVAVGTEEWPTPTGEWDLHRVDINPEWVPPRSEEWAKDEEVKAPGDPENPMGRARLVYRMPNTIHGTDDLGSLGKASSHGSIRVANEVALKLAEMLLKAGNSWNGEQWFQRMTQNRTQEYQIRLDKPIPIKVQE